MYALFCRKIWRAVQILEEYDQPEISLMISGFTEKFSVRDFHLYLLMSFFNVFTVIILTKILPFEVLIVNFSK